MSTASTSLALCLVRVVSAASPCLAVRSGSRWSNAVHRSRGPGRRCLAMLALFVVLTCVVFGLLMTRAYRTNAKRRRLQRARRQAELRDEIRQLPFAAEDFVWFDYQAQQVGLTEFVWSRHLRMERAKLRKPPAIIAMTRDQRLHPRKGGVNERR